jgi:hypothetical protein
MISIRESLLSKYLGKTRINSIWSRGRRGTRHHFSEIVIKGSHLLESKKWLR